MRTLARILIALALACAPHLLCAQVVQGEVGSYPNAVPLVGNERILADQATTFPCTSCTVNLTPVQVSAFLKGSGNLFPPYSIGYLFWNGTGFQWNSPSGLGTVTNVGLSMPIGFSVSPSSITTSGTFNVTTALNGVLKGSGGSFTTAAAGDVFGLWSGSCSSSTFLRGDGACAAPAGTVSTTGAPASGELTLFSGPTTVTNGNISGDCTTSGGLAITCTKSGGVAFAASATTDTTNASNISSGTLAASRLPAQAATITGSPVSGELTKFSGSNLITNGDLSGHCTTSGTLAITCTRLADASSALRIEQPGGGSLASTSSSVTGALKIRLPTAAYKSATMMMFKVIIYNYNVGTSLEILIGGFNHTDGTWINTSVAQLMPSASPINVRFGNDGTANCVWIGETSSVWNYPQVSITEFDAGYNNYTDALWGTGWALSWITSFDTVTNGPVSAGPTFAGGVVVGSPTGGNEGAGTVNAQAYYANGTPVNVGTTGAPSSGELAKFTGGTLISNGNLSGDCTTSNSLAVTCTATNGTAFGTFATANAASPPAIGGSTPAGGAFTTLSSTGATTLGNTTVSSLTDSSITNFAVQCLQINSSGQVSGYGSTCNNGGSPIICTTACSAAGIVVGQRITSTSTANTTRTSTTALTADANLQFTNLPPGSYAVRGALNFIATGNYTFNVSCSLAGNIIGSVINPTNSVTVQQLFGSGNILGPVNGTVTFQGEIVVSSTSGFSVCWGQNTSSGTSSILGTGSMIQLERTN